MQYLDKSSLVDSISVDDITNDQLISADAYNETRILENFLSYEKKVQKLLLKCAIHIAIVGAGNRTFGAVRDDDGNVTEIKDVFLKHKINFNMNRNEKYDDSALSARRLVRLFRFQIQIFIAKENRPSYLWFKYSSKDMTKVSICFPGAEHLIDNRDHAFYLLDCYYRLDQTLKTNFVPRITRVFIARGVFLPLEYESRLAIKDTGVTNPQGSTVI
jgi:hypothetical protein